MKRFLEESIKRFFSFFGLNISRACDYKIGDFKILDEFVDSSGNSFQRLSGYREKIWPIDWKLMNQSRAKPNLGFVLKSGRINQALNEVTEMEKLIQIYDYTLFGKKVLEVGCFSGANTYTIAKLGAAHVDGIDVVSHFINPPEKINDRSIQKAADWLNKFRETTAQTISSDKNIIQKVNFVDFDIREFSREDYYDLIVSWQTFEHILGPDKAMQVMYKALKPNGICYHKYHPFFCLSGAHFDTMDFPWGHIRLNSQDFRNYIKMYRQNDYDIAMWRFFETLNRMTLANLQVFAAKAGFQILALICPPEIELIHDIDQVLFSQCKSLYPTITISDLISSSVTILLRKPN